jgi:hypothetical protein
MFNGKGSNNAFVTVAKEFCDDANDTFISIDLTGKVESGRHLSHLCEGTI